MENHVARKSYLRYIYPVSAANKVDHMRINLELYLSAARLTSPILSISLLNTVKINPVAKLLLTVAVYC